MIATGLEASVPPRITPNNYQTYKAQPVRPVSSKNVNMNMNPNMGTAPIPQQVQVQAPVQPQVPTQAPKPAAQTMNVQPLSGIRRPGNIKSNVEEKTLSIPSFLQKK